MSVNLLTTAYHSAYLLHWYSKIWQFWIVTCNFFSQLPKFIKNIIMKRQLLLLLQLFVILPSMFMFSDICLFRFFATLLNMNLNWICETLSLLICRLNFILQLKKFNSLELIHMNIQKSYSVSVVAYWALWLMLHVPIVDDMVEINISINKNIFRISIHITIQQMYAKPTKNETDV